MADPCPVCGKDRVLVGWKHLCAEPRIISYSQVEFGMARDEIEALQAEVRKLKAELATRVGPTVSSPSDVGPTSDVHVGPTECPTCQARREAKAASQRRRRSKSA